MTTADIAAIQRAAWLRAAEFLEKTASDYDEMSERLMEQSSLRVHASAARSALVNGAAVMKDKAVLLRGQAGHIRKFV